MAGNVKLDLKIDTTRFMRMVEELARIDPGVEFGDVLDHEVGRVAFASQKATAAAKVGTIRRDHASREYLKLNGKSYKLTHRYPDALWRRIKADRERRLQDKLHARGLAKRSWLSAFPGLGVAPPGTIPGYVLTANYRGRQFANTRIQRTGSGNRVGVAMINTAPAVDWPAAKMRRALLRSINGRTAFFRRNMETGFYRTLASRAAKYPGIFVK